MVGEGQGQKETFEGTEARIFPKFDENYTNTGPISLMNLNLK